MTIIRWQKELILKDNRKLIVSQDPAIQQVTTNISNVQRGLEDYNPFADQGDQRPTAVRYKFRFNKYYFILILHISLCLHLTYRCSEIYDNVNFIYLLPDGRKWT
jgi:hypothetical protein